MKILLIDGHPLFRYAVNALVNDRWPGAARSVEVDSLERGLRLVESETWDLVLFDPVIAGSDRLEGLARLLRARPEPRILVASELASPEFGSRVLELGAAGYFDKRSSLEALTQALERVFGGGRYISPELAEYLVDRSSGPQRKGAQADLSAQEYRVMLQLAHGRRIADIGASMHLSPKTVSTYRTRVLRKLGIGSNADLVRYCIRQGLLRPEM